MPPKILFSNKNIRVLRKAQNYIFILLFKLSIISYLFKLYLEPAVNYDIHFSPSTAIRNINFRIRHFKKNVAYYCQTSIKTQFSVPLKMVM